MRYKAGDIVSLNERGVKELVSDGWLPVAEEYNAKFWRLKVVKECNQQDDFPPDYILEFPSHLKLYIGSDNHELGVFGNEIRPVSKQMEWEYLLYCAWRDWSIYTTNSVRIRYAQAYRIARLEARVGLHKDKYMVDADMMAKAQKSNVWKRFVFQGRVING